MYRLDAILFLSCVILDRVITIHDNKNSVIMLILSPIFLNIYHNRM